MYDYVIVGAGSAGCVLAARLSEDPDVTVCLIEAGPVDESQNIHVPAAFSQLFRTKLDWDYSSHDEPQLQRRRVYLPRGKMLGGTSSMNTMIYIRGNAVDFDGWGQPGWGYQEILPYFLRSEDNERGPSEYHDVGGPLSVSDNRSRNPMSEAFVEAGVEAGLGRNDDFNAGEQEGFGFFQLTQRDGRRWSTAAAFLRPALERPNLEVITDSLVHRVTIVDGRAVGVLTEQQGKLTEIRAGREVILSAGAYNSPQLLMLSGVGPASLLGMLGVPVVVDQPMVGQNLQDHVLIPLIWTHEHPVSMLAAARPENFQLFMEQGRGPLTCNGPEVGGFVRLSDDLPAPNVEYLSAPVMFADSGLGMPTAHAISFGPSMITPRSRGSVAIALPDPTAKPWIQHNYFAESQDMADAVQALRLARDLATKSALSEYVRTPYQQPASDSDADLAAYIRAYTHSIFHPAGTCAMGSVLDGELRVEGVAGLRVVDASVMPTLVRGNPNAVVIAIAEKAADLIAGRAQARSEPIATAVS